MDMDGDNIPGAGSRAAPVSNVFWTLNNNSIKTSTMRHPNVVPHRGRARFAGGLECQTNEMRTIQ